MAKIDRDDIHLISQHSNWTELEVQNALKEKVYSSQKEWKKFLQSFFVTLGAIFSTTGVIFFFAYNWADLHKFIKIGIVQVLLISLVSFELLSKLNNRVKNILLTASSVLVGVLFAVFGQVYQTGANAYDFFLGWTVFVFLWVFISNFPPLWLLFLVLINTTFIFYSEQVASNWSTILVFTVLAFMNMLFLITAILVPKYRPRINVPYWFSNSVAMAVIAFATLGIVIGIFDQVQYEFLVLIFFTVLVYLIGISYGLKEQKIFYLSLIPLSVIIIFSAFLIKSSSNEAMFLFTCLFIIGSVTLVVKYILRLQKKWNNERSL